MSKDRILSQLNSQAEAKDEAISEPQPQPVLSALNRLQTEVEVLATQLDAVESRLSCVMGPESQDGCAQGPGPDPIQYSSLATGITKEALQINALGQRLGEILERLEV